MKVLRLVRLLVLVGACASGFVCQASDVLQSEVYSSLREDAVVASFMTRRIKGWVLTHDRKWLLLVPADDQQTVVFHHIGIKRNCLVYLSQRASSILARVNALDGSVQLNSPLDTAAENLLESYLSGLASEKSCVVQLSSCDGVLLVAHPSEILPGKQTVEIVRGDGNRIIATIAIQGAGASLDALEANLCETIRSGAAEILKISETRVVYRRNDGSHRLGMFLDECFVSRELVALEVFAQRLLRLKIGLSTSGLTYEQLANALIDNTGGIPNEADAGVDLAGYALSREKQAEVSELCH